MLLSIQALVLCEQPYYNEAGYEKQLGTSEGAHHARRYNEGALLLSLKSMMTTLKHLSSPFEQLTTDHFRAAHRRILRRCHALLTLKDAPVAADAAIDAYDAAALPPSDEATAATSLIERAAAGTAADAAAGAAAAGAVAAAGLAGILNERPSGGFLHSLARQLAALEKAFEACDRAKQS